jgi:parallel beta-helix repeat protein
MGSGILKTGILTALLLSFIAFSVSAIDLSSCGVLDSPNTVYTLNSSINSSGTCITIGADNVTLDCQGYTILYGLSAVGYGVADDGFDYAVIRNCVIVHGQAQPESYGIFFYGGVSNGVIFNNTINTLGPSQGHGIYLSTSSGNNIIFNTVSTDCLNCHGIYLSSSSGNVVSMNDISANFSYSYGVWLSSSSGNNLSTNNITTFRTDSYGINFYLNSDLNTITDSSIRSNQSYAIYLTNTTGLKPENNVLYNNLLNGSTLPVGGTAGWGAVINYWNTSNQPGSRVYSGGDIIGGNYYTNEVGSGYSDTCIDSDGDGFCDLGYNVYTNTLCVAGLNCGNNPDHNSYSNRFGFPALPLLVVGLNEPLNDSEGIGNISFNATVYGSNMSYGNCSIYLNNTLNASIWALNNTKMTFTVLGLPMGEWLWTVTCWINDEVYNTSEIREYSVYATTTTTTTTTTTSTTTTTTTTTTTPTTSTTTSDTTTTTTQGLCELAGDEPPCGSVTLGEVVDYIGLWIADEATLSEVVQLINAWVNSS